METREGQDIAHSDYLGVRQGKHSVNTPPSTPVPRTPSCPHPTPRRTPLCLLHSLPLWTWNYAHWTAGGAASVCSAQPGLPGSSLSTQLGSSPNRAVCCASAKSRQLAPLQLLYLCSFHTSAQRNQGHKLKCSRLQTGHNNSGTMLRLGWGDEAHPSET